MSINCHVENLPKMHEGLANLKKELIRVGIVPADATMCCCEDDPRTCEEREV